LRLRLTSIVRRRPSPAMLVSLVALFMSFGGVGYAATQLANNSVGTAQIKNSAVTNGKLKSNAVTFGKITPGAVGTVRANLTQLQARVAGTCSAGQAIGAVDQTGKVTCNQALPSEFGTTNNSVSVTGPAATVTSVNLPAGAAYLALANPTATVTGSGTSERVAVSCTLTVGSNTQTRSTTVNTGTSTTPTAASIPLQVAGPAGTSSVSCTASVPTGTLPTTSVTAAINAIQTSSNS
jgi:hypothetical protein